MLKERTIGIAVFERSLDWDPKVDTIVRTEARRLRKKLADFYHNSPHTGSDLCITVPTGGYIPAFHFGHASSPPLAAGVPAPALDLPTNEAHRGFLFFRERLRPFSARVATIGFITAAFSCILLALSFTWNRTKGSANLDAFQNLPFTWEPGHQFSPAISPDEQRLAYVGEVGDGRFGIYLRSIHGGGPKLLTHGEASELNPRWSPDGESIALLRLHPTQAEVIVRRVSDGAEQLVASTTTQLGSWTGDPSPLVGDLGPDWTPDGKSLIVMDVAPHALTSGLVAITLADGSRHQITRTAGSIEDFFPRVSPNGQELAFVRTTTHGVGNLCLLDLRTLSIRQLTREAFSINGLTWSNDPGKLIFSSNREGAYQLWTVQISDGSLQTLNTNSTTALDPQAARQQKWIAYVRTNDSWSVDRIRLEKGTLTTSPEPFITSSGRNRDGQYSPDGNLIAFVSDRSGSWEIWLCDAACKAPHRLTNFGGPWIGGVSWSPDSKQVVFDARPNGHSAIYRMSIADASPKAVEENSFEERLPSWSSDGRFVYFNSDRGGHVSIWKRDLQTGAVHSVGDGGTYYEAREVDQRGTLLLARSDGSVWRASAGAVRSAEVVPGMAVNPVLGWTARAGTAFYCEREDAGHVSIYKRSNTGTELVARLQVQLPDSSESLEISPDGRYLLLTVIDHSSSNIFIRDRVTSPTFPDMHALLRSSP